MKRILFAAAAVASAACLAGPGQVRVTASYSENLCVYAPSGSTYVLLNRWPPLNRRPVLSDQRQIAKCPPHVFLLPFAADVERAKVGDGAVRRVGGREVAAREALDADAGRLHGVRHAAPQFRQGVRAALLKIVSRAI